MAVGRRCYLAASCCCVTARQGANFAGMADAARGTGACPCSWQAAKRLRGRKISDGQPESSFPFSGCLSIVLRQPEKRLGETVRRWVALFGRRWAGFRLPLCFISLRRIAWRGGTIFALRGGFCLRPSRIGRGRRGLGSWGGDVILPCGVFEIERAGAGEIARHA